jgi:hypothetical protein
MTLTHVVVLGPPETRRFRLLAPVLVLLGLALLALMPGILIHIGDTPHCASSAHRRVHDVRGALVVEI